MAVPWLPPPLLLLEAEGLEAAHSRGVSAKW